MDTRQLRYFVCVGEELHFGRAARRLGMAQPPLSQQIKKLEDDLGVTLFQRTSRSVVLTETGRILLNEARAILDQISSTREMISQYATGYAGRLNLGAVGPALDTFLPPIIQRFIDTFPQTRITLHEQRTDEQIEGLQKGRLDIGFLRLFGHDLAGLTSRIIYRDRYVLALPISHPLSSKRRISLKDLDGCPMIMAPRHHRASLHDSIVSCFQAHGAQVHVVQEASSKRTEIALVAAGIGCALVPNAYSKVFQRDGVVYRPIRGNLPEIEMVAVWQTENPNILLSRLLQLLASA